MNQIANKLLRQLTKDEKPLESCLFNNVFDKKMI